MAYEIGTASDYKDLLDRLRLFVTDPNRAVESAGMDIDEIEPIPEEEVWEVKRWDPDWDGDGNYELILSGPGVTGVDGILVGIQTYHNDTYGYYNWCLAGMTGFSALATFLNQTGVRGNSYDYLPHVFLNNASIQYWFVANGRRIGGVAKVGGTYYAPFYLGYYLPYGTPSQEPYPLMIGGSAPYSATASERLYSSSAWRNHGFVNPWMYSDIASSQYISLIIMLNGTWLAIGNYAGTVSESVCSSAHAVWPCLQNQPLNSVAYRTFAASGAPLLDGGHAVWPLMLVRTEVTNKNLIGEMHGFHATMSQGLVTEDTITIDGKTYLVFQHGSRNQTIDYFAMLKE